MEPCREETLSACCFGIQFDFISMFRPAGLVFYCLMTQQFSGRHRRLSDGKTQLPEICDVTRMSIDERHHAPHFVGQSTVTSRDGSRGLETSNSVKRAFWKPSAGRPLPVNLRLEAMNNWINGEAVETGNENNMAAELDGKSVKAMRYG